MKDFRFVNPGYRWTVSCTCPAADICPESPLKRDIDDPAKHTEDETAPKDPRRVAHQKVEFFETAIRKINFKAERDEGKEQSKCKEFSLPAKQLSCALQGA
jgi:hypothetical protein